MIHPTKGIRQGDLLSPFRFLLCIEGLHGLTQQAARTSDIKGFSLCQWGLELTHLLFANDNLLFYRATPEECEKVLGILNHYEEASGQKVNKNKTVIFFSTSIETKQEIKIALDLKEITQCEKYLGLPTFVGRNKKESFSVIKEKIWRKLQGWESKLLS